MSLAHGGGAIFTSGRLLCTHAYVVTTRVDPRESHSLSWLLAQDVQDVDKLREFFKVQSKVFSISFTGDLIAK